MGQRVVIRDNVARVIQTGPIGPAGPSGSNDSKTISVNSMFQAPMVFADGESITTRLAAANPAPLGIRIAIVGFGPEDGIYEGRSPIGSQDDPEQWLPPVRISGLEDYSTIVSGMKVKTHLDGIEFGPWVTSLEENNATWAPAVEIGSGGLAGVGLVTLVDETIGEGEDAVTYKVANVGGDGKAIYFIPTNPGDKVLLRPPADPDASKAEMFRIQFNNTDESVEFYAQIPILGETPQPLPMWRVSDGQGNISIGFICLPGALLGLDQDVWFPQPDVQSFGPPRSGQGYIVPTAVEDPGDGPDGIASMEQKQANVASVTVDAAGFTFIELKVANVYGARPFRLLFINATDLATVRITDDGGASADFNPDAVGVRVGTNVLGTVQTVATSPSLATIAYDPIRGTEAGIPDTHFKLVVPTSFDDWLGEVSGEVVLDSKVGYHGFVLADGSSANVTFNNLLVGEQAIVKLRVHNGYPGGGVDVTGGTIAVSVLGAPIARMSDIPLNTARDFEFRVWRDADQYYCVTSYGTATNPEDF